MHRLCSAAAPAVLTVRTEHSMQVGVGGCDLLMHTARCPRACRTGCTWQWTRTWVTLPLQCQNRNSTGYARGPARQGKPQLRHLPAGVMGVIRPVSNTPILRGRGGVRNARERLRRESPLGFWQPEPQVLSCPHSSNSKSITDLWLL